MHQPHDTIAPELKAIGLLDAAAVFRARRLALTHVMKLWFHRRFGLS